MGNKHRVPLHPHKKRFLSFPTVVETSSDCGYDGSRLKHKLAQAGSRANQPTGSALSPTWSEKVHLHLPLGGVLREGTRCTVKPVVPNHQAFNHLGKLYYFTHLKSSAIIYGEVVA